MLTDADLDFVARASALKRVVRKGWTRVPRVTDPESVADHTWGVALLATVAAARDPTLDAARLLRIAIVHDLAEAVVGDLVPGDYADAEEKHAREAAGLAELLEGVDEAVAAPLRAAWQDYETKASREARVVADLDKVDMALQARAYAARGAPATALHQFHESALRALRNEHLRSTLADRPPR